MFKVASPVTEKNLQLERCGICETECNNSEHQSKLASKYNIKMKWHSGIPTISPRGVKHKHAVQLPRAAIEATRIFPRFTSGLLRSSMNSAAGAEQQ